VDRDTPVVVDQTRAQLGNGETPRPLRTTTTTRTTSLKYLLPADDTRILLDAVYDAHRATWTLTTEQQLPSSTDDLCDKSDDGDVRFASALVGDCLKRSSCGQTSLGPRAASSGRRRCLGAKGGLRVGREKSET